MLLISSTVAQRNPPLFKLGDHNTCISPATCASDLIHPGGTQASRRRHVARGGAQSAHGGARVLHPSLLVGGGPARQLALLLGTCGTIRPPVAVAAALLLGVLAAAAGVERVPPRGRIYGRRRRCRCRRRRRCREVGAGCGRCPRTVAVARRREPSLLRDDDHGAERCRGRHCRRSEG